MWSRTNWSVTEHPHRKQQEGEDSDNWTNKDTQPRLDGVCE